MAASTAELCVFCRLRPAGSKEDVIPKWIRRSLPREPTMMSEVRLLDGTLIREATPAHTIITYAVCQKCNNHCMSALESAAKPYVGPALRGETVKLDRTGRRIVAAWAAKTAMMFECAHGEKGETVRSIPAEHYRQAYNARKQRRAPRRIHVTLARYIGGRVADGWTSHQLRWEPGSIQPVEMFPDGGRGYGLTFTIGPFVAQVLGTFGYPEHRDDRGNLREIAIGDRGIFADAVCPIWPSKTAEVTWPPRLALSETDLPAFEDAFVPNPWRDV